MARRRPRTQPWQARPPLQSALGVGSLVLLIGVAYGVQNDIAAAVDNETVRGAPHRREPDRQRP